MLSTTLRKARLPLWAAALFALLVPTASQAANNPLLIDAANTGANSTRLTGNFNGHLFSATDSSSDAQAVGVTGVHSATSGTGPGVLGYTAALTTGASGVLGYIPSATAAVGTAGVVGRTDSKTGGTDTGGGVYGVLGVVSPTTPGYWSAGVRGINSSTTAAGLGVWGSVNGSGWGVYGKSANGHGVTGYTSQPCSPDDYGNNSGVLGYTPGYAAYGTLGSCKDGAVGRTTVAYGAGVRGEARGTPSDGVAGLSYNSDSYGVYGGAPGGGFAGYFSGPVEVNGHLNVLGGCSGCTAPAGGAAGAADVRNGNTVTDGHGLASVRVANFGTARLRYQLTVLGHSFARAVVWQEVRHGTFTIRTDRPHVKVSWQVTRPAS